jgi:hypothetical protein
VPPRVDEQRVKALLLESRRRLHHLPLAVRFEDSSVEGISMDALQFSALLRGESYLLPLESTSDIARWLIRLQAAASAHIVAVEKHF